MKGSSKFNDKVPKKVQYAAKGAAAGGGIGAFVNPKVAAVGGAVGAYAGAKVAQIK